MKLFFRNDDVGWNVQEFERLLQVFAKNGQKINAAAIPSACADTYKKKSFHEYKNTVQFHTHGYAHLDHQSEGKKAEFGSARSHTSVKKELRDSFLLSQDLFGELFFPGFTPPWNRMDESLLHLLPEAGFRILSRDGGQKSLVSGIKDLNIQIDLHTSKHPRAHTVQSLFDDSMAIAKTEGIVGIMIHHKHMEDFDFIFIDQFLKKLTEKKVETALFSELESVI